MDFALKISAYNFADSMNELQPKTVCQWKVSLKPRHKQSRLLQTFQSIL